MKRRSRRNHGRYMRGLEENSVCRDVFDGSGDKDCPFKREYHLLMPGLNTSFRSILSDASPW